jgi:hypothetical protein
MHDFISISSWFMTLETLNVGSFLLTYQTCNFIECIINSFPKGNQKLDHYQGKSSRTNDK